MSVEVVQTCPLGSECEEAKNGKIHRCRWYTEIQGQDAQGNAHNKRDCSLAWLPILLLEQSRHNIANTSAINKFHHDTMKGQEAMTHYIVNSPKGLN